MSSFQQMFSFRRDEDETPEEFPEPPVWAGPSADELGECVPLSLVVGRSETAAIAVQHATAYSTGVTFDFIAVARGLAERDAQRLFHGLIDEEDPTDSFLRIGVELADGARISNLGNPKRHLWRSGSDPEGPIFAQHGGSSVSGRAGGITFDQTYWLWPLPPPGSLRVFVEWPALGVPLSSVEVDTTPILAAATQSKPLWPE